MRRDGEVIGEVFVFAAAPLIRDCRMETTRATQPHEYITVYLYNAAPSSVIPALPSAMPALPSVIPAKAGIQTLKTYGISKPAANTFASISMRLIASFLCK